MPLPPGHRALVNRDAAPLGFLDSLGEHRIAHVALAPLGFHDDHLAVAPVHADEGLLGFQLANDLTVMLPAAGGIELPNVPRWIHEEREWPPRRPKPSLPPARPEARHLAPVAVLDPALLFVLVEALDAEQSQGLGHQHAPHDGRIVKLAPAVAQLAGGAAAEQRLVQCILERLRGRAALHVAAVTISSKVLGGPIPCA